MKLAAIGDILAIPGFAALIIYFFMIDGKDAFEIILLCFSIGAMLADIYFTYLECVGKRGHQYDSVGNDSPSIEQTPFSENFRF